MTNDTRKGRSGSLYVSVVLAALVAYFGYQSWFNPQRAIKRQLGELATALSVPADRHDEAERLDRVERVRHDIAAGATIRLGPSGPTFPNRETFIAAMSTVTPPAGGFNVEFVDVQIALDSATDAHAYMTVEVTGVDARTGELGRDERELRVGIGKRDGNWVVTSAEPGTPARTQ